MAGINIKEMSPRYIQIIQYFADKIESGDLSSGDKLPTEEEICKFFNVSRITTRQALNKLESTGYIIKRQGVGSYVRNKMEMQLNSLQGFTEEMRSKGLKPRSELLSLEVIDPGAEIAEKLKIDMTVKVYSISRLRFADDVALSLENAYIPFFRCPGLERYDLSGSLYKVLYENYGVSMKKADQTIEAGFIDKKTAKLLGTKAGTQALIIERTTYCGENPFEYVKSVYRGDKYKFHVELYKND